MRKHSHLVLKRRTQNKFLGAQLVTGYPLFKTFDKIIKKDLHLLRMIEEVQRSYPWSHVLFSLHKKIN